MGCVWSISYAQSLAELILCLGIARPAAMITVSILLLCSAAVGLAIGPTYSVYMLLASAPILALVAATAARLSDFDFLTSVAITFACLTVSQMSYLLVTWLSMRHTELSPDYPFDDQSHDNSQDHVPDK
jgi:hypothetical protein